jgi:hypothetical protein
MPSGTNGKSLYCTSIRSIGLLPKAGLPKAAWIAKTNAKIIVIDKM